MSERLLIIVVDAEVRSTLTGYFRAAGFEVDAVASMDDALVRLSARRYSAVISDAALSAGGTEGLTIAQLVRATENGLPVLILTAFGSSTLAAAAARAGVDAYLHKPVSLVWLEGLVRARILARRGELEASAASA